MNAPESTSVPMNKKFVSQTELEEKRRQRQEEWEKVRKPDQPIEAPEEVYDPRSLYQQLQDEKTKKQEAYDDQFKLKNILLYMYHHSMSKAEVVNIARSYQVRGLEDDEADFLDFVSDVQQQQKTIIKYDYKNQVKGLEDDEAEFLDFVSDRQQQLLDQRKKEEDDMLSEYRFLDFGSDRQQQLLDQRKKEEDEMLSEYRNALTVAPSTGDSQTKSTKTMKPVKKDPKKSQLQLLAGAVKRKGGTDKEVTEGKKQKVQESAQVEKRISANTPAECEEKTITQNNTNNKSSTFDNVTESIDSKTTSQQVPAAQDSAPLNGKASTLQVAGVLPGLCVYTDSDSSSDDSSSSFSAQSPQHGHDTSKTQQH